MIQKSSDDRRALELTALIDVVFLLLIFFLVSFAFSLAGDVSQSTIYADMELPKSKSEPPMIQADLLENLMIQITPDTVNQFVSKMVYILWPSFNDSIKISRVQALSQAIVDSTFAAFPQDFLELPAAEFEKLPPCNLIKNSIESYIEKGKFYRRKRRPLIEIRADQNTEFQILSFIMNQCSAYNDVIPQIVIRTVQ